MGAQLLVFLALGSFSFTIDGFALIFHDSTTPLRLPPLLRPLTTHRLRTGDATDAEAYDIGAAPAVRFANWVTEANYDADDEVDNNESSLQSLGARATGKTVEVGSDGAGRSGSTEGGGGSEATGSAGQLRSISQALWRALASEKRLDHYTHAEQVSIFIIVMVTTLNSLTESSPPAIPSLLLQYF